MLALLLFATAVLTFVAILDFDLEQSRQVQTEPAQNLVGVIGAESSFWGFYAFGISVWLFPIFLTGLGIRYLLQQVRRKRVISYIAVLVAQLSAAGLATMLELSGVVHMEGGLFERQLSQGVGGLFGELLAASLLAPLVGPFGAVMLLLIGFMVGSVVVFTDNFGKLLEYVQARFSETLRGAASRRRRAKS